MDNLKPEYADAYSNVTLLQLGKLQEAEKLQTAIASPKHTIIEQRSTKARKLWKKL